LVARIRAAAGTAAAVPTDVTDEAQARSFIARATSEFGRLDVLVNNAGVMLLGLVAGAPTEEWRRMIDLNILGVLYCTHAALPAFSAGGHIVNISSIAGKVAGKGSAVYSLTKFGIGAFSEALRQEGMESGVRVTLIEPGRVNTELLNHVRPAIRDGITGRWAGVTPLEPQDVAAAVLFALTQPENAVVNEIVVRPAVSPF
jgi:NADP-dependent 3-hydroxy acid dehydrogenase YdfG